MQTTITARHCEVPDALRARAAAVAERLAARARRPLEAAVVFAAAGAVRLVELRLHDARGDFLVAHGAAADHRTALDRAEAKLRRQVERVNGRPRRIHPRPAQPS